MEQNNIIILNNDQLKALVADATRLAIDAVKGNATDGVETPTDGARYVYGLRGIRELFGVSHATAQKYKDTFLAPAVYQRGRKIVVDANRAIGLFNEHRAQ